jgi:flagellar protein FlbD
MIRLTRLNNQQLAVNSDMIKFIEQAPDTVLTLVSGDKIVVRESSEEVLDRILSFRRSISLPVEEARPTNENAAGDGASAE